MGLLTLEHGKVAYWAEATIAGAVPASVFYPRPNVDSSLVSIHRRPAPAVDPYLVDRRLLFELVRAGFATRRKMLRGALAGRVAGVAAMETMCCFWSRTVVTVAPSGRDTVFLSVLLPLGGLTAGLAAADMALMLVLMLLLCMG